MAHSKQSIFSDKELKVLAGSACYVEIALTAKEWRFTKLEELIDGRCEDEKSNYYRKLANGAKIEDKTIARIKESPFLRGKRCYIKKWRDHPLWGILKTTSLMYVDIERALSVVTGPVQNFIWFDKKPMPVSANKRPARFDDLDNHLVDYVAYRRSFNALLILVALAREAYHSNHARTYYQAAQKSLEIFPEVMVKCPHLYLRWKILAKRLTDVIWKPTSHFSTFDDLPVSLNALERHIHELDTKAREKSPDKLPPKYFIERYNRA